MREIKFRAWEPLERKIIPWEKLWVYDGKLLSGVFGQFQRSGGVLMQYTDLHDKNGKEIYEGDIVQLKDEQWEVKWSDGGFILDAWDVINEHYARQLKVIGNIYESPEILKEVQR